MSVQTYTAAQGGLRTVPAQPGAAIEVLVHFTDHTAPRQSRVGRVLAGRFVRHMKREMDRNAYKGDAWREASPVTLTEDLVYHALKLARAVSAIENGQHVQEAALEFAADVANLAAMVADNLGTAEHFTPAAGPVLGWGGTDIKALAADTCIAASRLVVTDPDY